MDRLFFPPRAQTLNGIQPFCDAVNDKVQMIGMWINQWSVIMILFRQDMHHKPKLWRLIADLVCPFLQLTTGQKNGTEYEE